MSLDLHAPLAPSSADVTVYCPGSVQAQQKFPELVETEDQRVGTAAHWVMAEALFDRLPALQTITPNGEAVTQEMLDGAEMMERDVCRVLKPNPTAVLGLRVEQRVYMPQLHEHNWGTPDVWLMDWATMTLYVWDYKFGYGYVEVRENQQCIDYVAGIMNELKIDGVADQNINVVISIVQPRFYDPRGPVRTWKIKMSELRGYFNIMRQSFDEAMKPNPRMVSGKHCKHCRAAHACQTNNKAAAAAIDYIDSFSIDILSDENIGIAARMLEDAEARVKSRLSSLKVIIEERLRRKQMVIGWVMQPVEGRKKWNVTNAEAIALGELIDINFANPPEPMTPTQALALLKRNKIDSSFLKDFYDSKGGIALTRHEDSLAMSAFKKVD